VVHSSYSNENPGIIPVSNERLEFLGDAVLGFIVAEKLYQDFPDLTEGEMTRLRSVLVSRSTLAGVARAINLGNYLCLGKGEEASDGRNKPANLAGALEAVIAAVAIDQGLDTVRELVLKLLSEELQEAIRQDTVIDDKSRLQEIIQAKYRAAPVYRLVGAVGPDHDKRFTVEVMGGGVVLGMGSGKSKKMAETEAARLALKKLAASFTQ
jgi:ribonuclease-3